MGTAKRRYQYHDLHTTDKYEAVIYDTENEHAFIESSVTISLEDIQ